MFKNNFKLTLRHLYKYKMYALLNILGMAVGLACALLIFLWVSDELSVDKFHTKDNRLFQVRVNYAFTEITRTNFETDGILAQALSEEMPEVEYATVATPVHWFGKFTLSVGNENIKATGKYAGKNYFNIFSYNLVQGDKDQVLAEKNAIVISSELARKLFRTTENVIGQTVELQQNKQLLVSGIFEGTPYNSSEQFDFVLPFSNFQEENPRFTQWDQRGPSTYLLLNKDTNIDQFNIKLNNFYQGKTQESNITLFVNRYSDNYLYGYYENGVQAGGRIDYVILFSLIAVFILTIACINFMNLSTAKAAKRTKEIGIKKTVGAPRKSLIFQYLGETILLTVLSFCTAVIFVLLFLPMFNDLTAKNIAMSLNTNFVLSFFGLIIFSGFLAGSYPAAYLSGLNPITVLKGRLSSSVGEFWARKGLVVFQFVISITLIVAVLVIFKQVEFVQTKNIGYDKDNLISFDMEGRVAESPEVFLSGIKRLPGIVNASSIGSRLIGSYGSTSGLDWEGKRPEERILFETIQVNYDMIETLGIEMTAGRTFSRDFSSDRSRLIFNEAAIQAMGLENPVGKIIKFWGNDAEILGICKDFHIESLHEKVKPLFFRLLPEHTSYIIAKIEAGKERGTINKLRAFYKTFNPGFILDYKFMDEAYQALYESEKRVAGLSGYFAGLAIFISCLGLFGLSAFTAERRVKEIGIRKVLGSSSFAIVRLISADFTKMVLLAIVIALPASYFIAQNWLLSFAYRIELEPWYFAAAGLLALLTALVTVGTQAIRGATVNPVQCLRDE